MKRLAEGIDAGFLLDRQWHWMRGEMETTKKPTLSILSRLLDDAGVDWVLIGGVAVQIHRADPRMTLDIDVAIPRRESIPREALERAGF